MQVNEILIIMMFLTFFGLLFTGFPIALVLCGVAFLFTVVGNLADVFLGTDTGLNFGVLAMINSRLFKLMSNWVMMAIPMFICMGFILDKSGIAEKMMEALQKLFSQIRGGLAISVTLVGIILAASTGIIGASIVLLSLLSLPVMLKHGYDKNLALGTVAASGCLGILIPPSIMLVIMADQLTISVGDLFMGAIIPGVLLGAFYIAYIAILGLVKPAKLPLTEDRDELSWSVVADALKSIIPPAGLILLVLGSIFAGVATPTEASGMGVLGAMLVSYKRLSFSLFKEVGITTFKTCGFIFGLLVGATVFSLVLRLLGGDDFIEKIVLNLPFGAHGKILCILFAIFLMGFFLDWTEISFIFLPLLGPIIPTLGLEICGHGAIDNPELVWFALMVAITLQTSFLTPPVGTAIFFLQGVSPKGVTLVDIYKGNIPFIILQLLGLAIVFFLPQLVIWLPVLAYR